MKRIFSLLLVVAMLLTVCVPVVATSDEATLIYSFGSFEAKDTSIISGSMRKGYEYTEEHARTGKVSLKAIGSEEQSGGWLWISNSVTFEKGKTYSVRFYATSDKGATVSAQLFIDGSTSVTAADASQAIPVGSWGEYVTNFTWDKDAASARILLKFGGEGNIYVDDLEIYEGTYSKTVVEDADVPFCEITPDIFTVNVYVDGSAASGGNGSINAPFNTIEAAQSYVRTINDDMTCDIVVNIKGGTYQITDTINLTDEDSGTNGYYVIYQPYNYNGVETQEKVVISGGKAVTEWTESEIDGVYSAPVDVDVIRNLYVNGTRAQRARYNSYVTPISWWDDTENTLSTKDGFVIPGGIINNPEKATNLEIYRTATFRSNWAVKGTAVADGDTTIIKMEQPYFYLHELANYSVLEWKIADNFRLENALEFLDEPGEWYHDVDTDTLYYMPRAGESMANIEVIAPDVEKLLDIRGSSINNRAENIIVRGLTFSHGAYKKTSRLGRANLQATTCYSVDMGGSGYQGAQTTTEGNINILNAKNVSLYDNVINHMGAVAVAMPDGVFNCELKGNAIYDISSCAVTIGTNRHSKVTDIATVPKNILITNNVIGDTGVEYGSDPSIQGYFTNGLTISHNEVYNSAYSAICVGWDWTSTQDTKKNNTVEYNRIYNYGTECQDGGAIYTLGCQPNSVVRGNYIRSYEQDIVGIYHDEGSTGITTTGNVVDMPADSPSSGLYDHSLGDGLNITGNYTNVVNSTADRENFCNNYTEQGSTRSPEALAIRAAAGLESGFSALRNKVDGYSDNTTLQRIYLQTEEQKNQTPANITVGESLTLKTLGENRNGEISEITTGLTYQVSDASVLSVEGNRITAISNGISNVTVKDANGNTAFMTITVGDEIVSFEVLADKNSTKVGETVSLIYRLKTKYTEYTAKPRKADISTSDAGIITVLSDGTVKTVGEGVGTATVSVQCGDFIAEGTTTVVVSDGGYRTFKKLALNSTLTYDDILSNLGGSSDAEVSEEAFVNVLAAIIQRDSSEICEELTTATLTKEKMVAILADVLVNVYGEAPMVDTELHQYTDRAEINPSLVPKIALAYECGLLSWIEESSVFEPKKKMTVADAADFLYRFARPEEFEYLRKDESRFSTYTSVAEWLILRDYPAKHAQSKQRNFEAEGEESIEISNTIHEGTLGVSIEDGELVQKVSRSTAYSAVSILLINSTDFVPGKSYTMTFSAKVSGNYSGTFATGNNELSVEPKFSVTEDTIGVSKAKISSSDWTMFTVPITIPDDATYPLENNSIYIRLRNTSALDTYCYDILFKDMVITEEAEATITSSTIADGEKDVMTPIDSVYIRSSSPIDENALTVDKFTLTGGSASVTAVDAVDESTIKVSLSGTEPMTEYTLTVSGVATLSGGKLNDTLTWTTAKAPSVKSGGWDFENSSKTGVSADGSGVTSADISADYAHSGTHSLKLTTTNHGNAYINHTGAGFTKLEKGKDYMISYWIYSPDKSMRTGIYKHLGSYRVVAQTTITKGVWTKMSGVFSPTEDAHIANELFIMEVFDNPGTCYVDDLEIVELQQNPVTVNRPNIFIEGIPVSRVDRGNVDVSITITGGTEDKSVRVVLAQYDDDNYMRKVMISTDTVKAGENKTITINLPDAQNLKTKILVMGETSYEPYNDAIVMDKIVK